ncbi:MAG: PKD domain-containing protein [Nitrospirae bacterium]|nr:PKD domain-containing protein [Nitrospirota bacterium]
MKSILKTLAIVSSFLLLAPTVFAYSGDISINSQNINFSTGNFMEGSPVRIYSTATNNSNQDLLGVVRFFDNDAQVGGDQAISLFAGKTDDVFIDWVPTYGNHKIAVKIYPWKSEIDDPSNNWTATEVFAVQDTDYDGIPNETDNDDDGDGVPDSEDAFSLNSKEQYDTDGDGIGNNADEDDDGDEVPDEFDEMPLDPNETTDTDKDGIGNTADNDDDGDGLTDAEEENIKTDPLDTDTDDDTYNDKEDIFPLNPNEWLDTDADKLGNNKDTDDDNDGIPDTEDDFPLNKGPVIKFTNEDFDISLFETYLFDASPSYDKDGEIVSYLWEIDGEILEGNSVTYSFNKLGEHDIKLTIKDDSGEIRSQEFQANVLNTRFYTQLLASMLLILLALVIYFKYISEAKIPNKERE